jgi:hypothetical protein
VKCDWPIISYVFLWYQSPPFEMHQREEPRQPRSLEM